MSSCRSPDDAVAIAGKREHRKQSGDREHIFVGAITVLREDVRESDGEEKGTGRGSHLADGEPEASASQIRQIGLEYAPPSLKLSLDKCLDSLHVVHAITF